MHLQVRPNISLVHHPRCVQQLRANDRLVRDLVVLQDMERRLAQNVHEAQLDAALVRWLRQARQARHVLAVPVDRARGELPHAPEVVAPLAPARQQRHQRGEAPVQRRQVVADVGDLDQPLRVQVPGALFERDDAEDEDRVQEASFFDQRAAPEQLVGELQEHIDAGLRGADACDDDVVACGGRAPAAAVGVAGLENLEVAARNM